jgi:hypothetical protein
LSSSSSSSSNPPRLLKIRANDDDDKLRCCECECECECECDDDDDDGLRGIKAKATLVDDIIAVNAISSINNEAFRVIIGNDNDNVVPAFLILVISLSLSLLFSLDFS